MTLYDSSYKHWSGRHHGVWRRRGVIALNGLKGCFQAKWMRFLVSACWILCLVQIGFLFLLGQLLITDSIVVRWLGNLSKELQSLANGLISWLVEHPEISVHTSYNLLFFFFTTRLLPFSIIAVALAIPHIITRDLASQAIVIYSSKAVSRVDYLLGKLGTLFGLLCLTWLGPVCLAWLVGSFLATDWGFFWHSRRALGNALLFVLIGMAALSIIGMGVSAVSGKERNTVSLWVFWWLIGGALVGFGQQAKPWLKFVSFHFDLRQIALGIFRLEEDIRAAQENLPFFGQMLRNVSARTMESIASPEVERAFLALGTMALISVGVVLWKVRPE